MGSESEGQDAKVGGSSGKNRVGAGKAEEDRPYLLDDLPGSSLAGLSGI